MFTLCWLFCGINQHVSFFSVYMVKTWPVWLYGHFKYILSEIKWFRWILGVFIREDLFTDCSVALWFTIGASAKQTKRPSRQYVEWHNQEAIVRTWQDTWKGVGATRTNVRFCFGEYIFWRTQVRRSFMSLHNWDLTISLSFLAKSRVPEVELEGKFWDFCLKARSP